MADVLKQLYDELVDIRTYLIKIGPSRRKGAISDKKLKEAHVIDKKYCESLDTIKSKIKLGRIERDECKIIDQYCDKFSSLYLEIIKLCTPEVITPVTMDFDLKVALNLLPVLDGKETTTKQLIDGIEYYDTVINEASKVNLINFVLKSRLSQSAKLIMGSAYSTVSALILDMRKHLLPKKSATAIQTTMQNMRQNELSINDYGQKLSEMFVDLTIAQADGNDSSFSVLKPLNEQQAIKRFADGLRNRRLSTIVAARNFTSLKDAIQAAIDEEVSLPSTSNGILTMNRNYYRQGRGRVNFNQPFRGRGKQYQQERGAHTNNYGRGWSRGQPGNRGNSRSRGFYRGRYYHNSNFGNQRRHNVNMLSNDQSESENLNNNDENQFFRS